MKLSTIAVAAAVLFGGAALSQAQMPNRYDHVAHRQINQQHRIAAGVRDGQASSAAKLQSTTRSARCARSIAAASHQAIGACSITSKIACRAASLAIAASSFRYSQFCAVDE
jgi:hypothetical protein